MIWFKNKEKEKNKNNVNTNANIVSNAAINQGKKDNSHAHDANITTIKETNKLIKKKVTGLMDNEGDFISSINKIDESAKYTNTKFRQHIRIGKRV